MIPLDPAVEEKLSIFERQVIEENGRQNLISAATVPEIRTRHSQDSLQLLALAPGNGRWLDVGSGAGFPGIALAIASPHHWFDLVEPRAKRADFLQRAVEQLGLENVTVHRARVETTRLMADIISARAVANLAQLFAMASGCATKETLWLLPKGRSAREELDEAMHSWQGDFDMTASQTDPDAQIIVARNIRRRAVR